MSYQFTFVPEKIQKYGPGLFDSPYTLENSNCHILWKLLFTQSKSLFEQCNGSKKNRLLQKVAHYFLLCFGFCRLRWWCDSLASSCGIFLGRCCSCFSAFLFFGCLLACKSSSCLRRISLLSSLNRNSAAAYSFSLTLRDMLFLQLANTSSIFFERIRDLGPLRTDSHKCDPAPVHNYSALSRTSRENL